MCESTFCHRKPKSLWHSLNHLTFESLHQGLNHWNLGSWQHLSDGYFSVFSIFKKKKKKERIKKATQSPVWGGQTFLSVHPSVWGWEEIKRSSPEEASMRRPALLTHPSWDSIPSWGRPSTCGMLQESSPPAYTHHRSHTISSLHSLFSLVSALRKLADTEEIIRVMMETIAGMQESQTESPAQGRGARQALKGGDARGWGHNREHFSTPDASYQVEKAVSFCHVA